MKINNLGLIFESKALKNSNPCFIFDNNQSLTFDEVNSLSNKILCYLKKNNVYEGDILAIKSTKNIISLSLIIACLKGGMAYSFIELFSAKKEFRSKFLNLNQKKFYLFQKI